MNMTFRPMDVARNVARPAKTFAEAAESYLERKPQQRRYLDRIIARIGHLYLDEIAPLTIREIAEELYPTQTNSTRNRCALAPIRAVYYHGYDRLWCNPIRLKAFKEDAPKERPYATFEWMVIFLRQCRIDGLHSLAALALFINRTAARISEALRLEWQDVDLIGRKAILRKTKTGTNSVRYLSDDLVRYLHGLNYRPGARVFGRKCRHNVNDRIRAICKRAGIRYLTTHEIGRRAYAKNTVLLGIDTKTAMEGGGWASSKVFLERYVSSPDGGKIVAERFSSQRYDLEV